VKGCLNFIGLLFLGFVVLVIWIGLSSNKSTQSSGTDSPVSPAPQPHGQQADPSAPQAASPLSPSISSATPGTAPPSQDISNDGISPDTLAAISAASKNLKIATAVCIARLKTDDDYQHASQDEADSLSKLQDVRKAGDQDAIAAASQTHMHVAGIIKKMEEAALADDADVQKAAKALRAAVKREKAELAAIEARRRAEAEIAVVRAKQDAQAEADRIANDPIHIAITQHHLIRGMTWAQAQEALGAPYSIMDAGDTWFATWERGQDNYWSATFVDGVAEVVDHTRL
jgi:hypothetical protein